MKIKHLAISTTTFCLVFAAQASLASGCQGDVNQINKAFNDNRLTKVIDAQTKKLKEQGKSFLVCKDNYIKSALQSAQDASSDKFILTPGTGECIYTVRNTDGSSYSLSWEKDNPLETFATTCYPAN